MNDNEHLFDARDLNEAVARWEESAAHIARGWDDIEEYQFELSEREELDRALAVHPGDGTVPEALTRRIKAADDLFRQATVESKLCVWHCGPQFRAFPDGTVELAFEQYDPDEHWYYYRWQPDSSYPFREHDGISYQRQEFGMDFQNMTVKELKTAARREVARWHEIMGRSLPDGYSVS